MGFIQSPEPWKDLTDGFYTPSDEVDCKELPTYNYTANDLHNILRSITEEHLYDAASQGKSLLTALTRAACNLFKEELI